MRKKNHTIVLNDDTSVTTKANTDQLITKIDKANHDGGMLLFKSISCNMYKRGAKYLYTYFFSLRPAPEEYMVTLVNVRPRDTKYAVNTGNSVWDSPYHIPLQEEV
mgnify:CR=1 FL=1